MKLFILSSVFILAAAHGGCSDPNAVGVQDFGSVTGRVLNAKTNAPVGSALVSVGSLVTGNSGPQGEFTLDRIPAGKQVVTVTAAGFDQTTTTVTIVKDTTTSVGYIKLTPL